MLEIAVFIFMLAIFFHFSRSFDGVGSILVPKNGERSSHTKGDLIQKHLVQKTVLIQKSSRTNQPPK